MSIVVFPSQNAWITPRTTEAKIDSSNCMIILSQKISEVNRVLVDAGTVEVKFGQSGETTSRTQKLNTLYFQENLDSRVQYLDITDYIVEQAKYNTLPVKNVSAENLITELSANNAHYYEHNGNTIFIVGTTFKGSISFWASTSAWNMAIQASFEKLLSSHPLLNYNEQSQEFTGIYSRPLNVASLTNNPMSARFRVYYTPLGESVKLKSVKVNPQPQQFTIPFSQQQPIVNNTTMGKEMQSIANRTGCETIQVPRVIPSMQYYRAPGTIYKEKDKDNNFTGNIWRLTSCELLIYSDTYIKVMETWSKNWTYRSPNVPINREFRSWNIPADIVQRNLHYNDYCIFSRKDLSQQLDDDALISGEARKILARKLRNLRDTEGISSEMSNVWFMRESSTGSDNPDIGAVMSCSAFGFGTSLVFSCRTKDNLSAGVQRVKSDNNDQNYQFCKDVYYCDDDGKLENLWIQVANIINWGSGNPPMLYPEYNSDLNYPAGTLLFRTTGQKTNKFHIQKDPSEQLNFTYQLHFLSADGFLVIGSAWAANNELVKTPDKPNKVKIWGLSKAIPNGLPVMTTEYGEASTDGSLFSSGRIGVNNVRIFLVFSPKNYKGVCVTDENDNVLVAYNNSEPATYYGTFTHNYEDIYDALFDMQENETENT